MKKIKYPDYANSTVSLANSILKYFGAPVHHETLGLLDRKFAEREYENVVVILLDGMGKCIVDGNLEPDGFFASHLAGTYSAVFPPTTVAATTSICSGLYPVEHCWLGWDCYYPKIDKTVTVFLNREAGTTRPAAEYPVAETFCPYKNLVKQIRENGGQAYSLIPFEEPYPKNFEAISGWIEELTSRPGKKYIYAYWSEPDGCMHEKGCYSPEAKAAGKTGSGADGEAFRYAGDRDGRPWPYELPRRGHRELPENNGVPETGPESGAEGCEFLREGREKAAV